MLGLGFRAQRQLFPSVTRGRRFSAFPLVRLRVVSRSVHIPANPPAEGLCANRSLDPFCHGGLGGLPHRGFVAVRKRTFGSLLRPGPSGP
jgi:hypothetical protein